MSAASKKMTARTRAGVRARKWITEMDKRIEKFFANIEFERRLFCPIHHTPVDDRGGWFHCVPCGHAVTPVDASGKEWEA